MACISAMVTSPLPQNTSTCSFSTLQFSPGIDSNKVTTVQITLDKRGGSAQLTPIYFLRPQELQAFEWIHFRNKTNTITMIFYVILKWTDPSNKNANHVCRPNTIGAFRKLRPARRSASFRCRGSLGGWNLPRERHQVHIFLKGRLGSLTTMRRTFSHFYGPNRSQSLQKLESSMAEHEWSSSQIFLIFVVVFSYSFHPQLPDRVSVLVPVPQLWPRSTWSECDSVGRHRL